MVSMAGLKRSMLVTALMGSGLSLGFSLLSWGMGAAWSFYSSNNPMIAAGDNPFKGISIRLALIGGILLIYGFAIHKLLSPTNVALHILLLLLLFFQSILLIDLMPMKLPDFMRNYSQGMEVILYSGIAVFVIAIILSLQLGVWGYRQKTTKPK
jgi:hypothetical protein